MIGPLRQQQAIAAERLAVLEAQWAEAALREAGDANVLADRWDANGQLWKTLWSFNYVMPDFPGTVQQTFGFYDLLSGQGYVSNVLNDKAFHHKSTARWPDVIFTGDGLAAQGVR